MSPPKTLTRQWQRIQIQFGYLGVAKILKNLINIK